MLKLKNVSKTYRVGDIKTEALMDVSVSFRACEFVAILGPSGSGKTTCLNIIGGLDRYDSGDMIIKGKHTSAFSESEWDAYRNNSIGFVFQSYNLIGHLSIVDNVAMGMALSGVPTREKRQRALDVLTRVGLKDHLHKKPTQLSGGQMQRVAIARALANDPEILLCDEPTGALDSATSLQIMDLIKEVAADRLVIMVTHNPALADRYADRVIRFEDGRIASDSRPCEADDEDERFSLKRTSMSFATALKLSFNNIRTKKGRAFLTAFASSIGIIGIALILSLSNGFQEQIEAYQGEALANFPIIISQTAAEIDENALNERRQLMIERHTSTVYYPDIDEVLIDDSTDHMIAHQNKFTEEYMDYLEAIDPDIVSGIGYTRIVGMHVLREVDGEIVPVTLSSSMLTAASQGAMSMGGMSGMSSVGLSSYPENGAVGGSYLKDNYDILAGEYPSSDTDLVLVIGRDNGIDKSLLTGLGFDAEGLDALPFSEIVGTEFKLIANDDYYNDSLLGMFTPSTDYAGMYASESSLTLRISGIVRSKEGVKLAVLADGVAYSDALARRVIAEALNSKIVKAQKNSGRNVLTLAKLGDDERAAMISYLGGNETPFLIMLYPSTFADKDAIVAYLDAYNVGKDTEDVVLYTDLASTISMLTSDIMDGITIVLVAFAAISLVVSLIMISIITYTSVIERTKEIGILKALGARKKDITRVFDAETFILGALSGTLGMVIAWLLTFPANAVLYQLTELQSVARLRPEHVATLILLSTALTILGGHIPARMAARKDAVEALRIE